MKRKSYMAKSISGGLGVLAMAIIPAVGASAQDNQDNQAKSEKSDSPFSFEVIGGVEYDSNISVIELDQNTSTDDFAGAIDVEAEFETDVGKDTEFSVSYDFSQSLHFDVTDFDIQSHRGNVSLDHDFGPVTTGISYIYSYSTLGGDGFLTLQRITPSVAGFVGKKVYLRANYDYTDKDFKNRMDRDATSNAVGLSAFYFLDGTTTFFSGGYRLVLEDGFDPRFDYDGHNFRIRFSHDIKIGEKEIEFDMGWRYEKRDYENITPSIGAIRDDKRHRFEVNLEIPLTKSVFAILEYEYDNFKSNLPSADFNQNLAAVRLGARF